MSFLPAAHATGPLASFRRGAQDTGVDVPAVFVLEPHMWRTAGVVASWRPVSILQVLGATSGVSSDLTRTIEHALTQAGAAQVVLCGEGPFGPTQGVGGRRLLECRAALAEDLGLGALLRANAIPIEALWFDLSEGDIHRWDPEVRRFDLLSDRGLSLFFESSRARCNRLANPGRK
jgi:hypothetical protein